jgi:O-antigen/teichoic acid export membrane protein
VSALRNSVSDVLLPEMSSAGSLANAASVRLWQRSTVVFAILLLPIATVLCAFAAPLIELVFSSRYLPAVPVFQVYLLVLVRECFDFDLALRAAGQPRRALVAHVVTLVVNLSLALWLVRQLGVVGAGVSMITARAVSGVYLARCVADVVNLRLRDVFPWSDLLRVVCAIGLAALTLIPAIVYPEYGWLGRIACGAAFGIAFFALLRLFDVGEIRWLYSAIGRRVGRA